MSDLGTAVGLRPAPALGEANELLRSLPPVESREPAPLMTDASKLLEGLRFVSEGRCLV